MSTAGYVLKIDAQPGAELRYEGKVVGCVMSAVPGVALAYVRNEVPTDADVSVG